MERGAFDDLPGAGKPIPRSDDADDGQAWLRAYVRREGVPAEAFLPAPLKLRKEIERLTETARELATEQVVRDRVADLNRRILEWRRIPVGPAIFVPLADEEAIVGRWREAQPRLADSRAADVSDATAAARPASRPWWRRVLRVANRSGT
jgi:hypothetical protein